MPSSAAVGGFKSHQPEIADLEARGGELLGVEALDLVERGARADVQPMESGRMAAPR